MTRNATKIVGAILLALGAGVAFQAKAQQEETQTVDVEAMTCKEVMILSGMDRETTISYIHGYVAGKHGHASVDLDALTVATEAFVNNCLDSPTAKAVATLEAALN